MREQGASAKKGATDVPRKCYNCGDYPEPKRKLVCFNGNKTGHISKNCPDSKPPMERTVQTIGMRGDSAAEKYLKEAKINGRVVRALIDPGRETCIQMQALQVSRAC